MLRLPPPPADLGRDEMRVRARAAYGDLIVGESEMPGGMIAFILVGGSHVLFTPGGDVYREDVSWPDRVLRAAAFCRGLLSTRGRGS